MLVKDSLRWEKPVNEGPRNRVCPAPWASRTRTRTRTTKKVQPAEVCRVILSNCEVQDFSVEEEPIEEIIRQVFYDHSVAEKNEGREVAEVSL